MGNVLRCISVGGNEESRRVLGEFVCRGLPEGVDLVGHVLPAGRLAIAASDRADLSAPLEALRVDVHSTDDINSADTLEWMRHRAPQLILTFGWSQVFGPQLLAIPHRFVVGSHPSLLPYGRGRAPIPWTILEGLEKSGVTLFQMGAGIDDGPILAQETFGIGPQDHAREVYDKAASSMARGFMDLLAAEAQGTLRAIIQDESAATFRERRTPWDGYIDWRAPRAVIHRLIRAVSEPYPGALTHHGSRLMAIHRCVERPIPKITGLPGQVLRVHDEAILIQCGDGALWVADLRFPEAGDEEPMEALRRGVRLGISEPELLHRILNDDARLADD